MAERVLDADATEPSPKGLSIDKGYPALFKQNA
jgi:hypothetical protein